MVPFKPITAIGYMEYSDMKHLVQDIGHAGMVLQLNNYALVVYFIMKMRTVVIGQKM